MTKIKQLTNVLALCTIVGLSAYIGYLLADNQSKAYTINEMEKELNKAYYINSVNLSNHIKDSIRNEHCPEVKVEKDSEGNYTFYYK